MKHVNWKEIVLFFTIATAVSAPFRLRWITPEEYIVLPAGLNILFNVLRGMGPVVAYSVMYYVVKSKVPQTMSFFGKDRAISSVAALVILVGLSIVGVQSSDGLNAHYFGFLYGVMLIAYSLCEEYGWRGYLQQALEPLPIAARIVAIAFIWFIWHLNFLKPDVSLQTHVIHFLFLLAGSWGLLKITGTTRSILFASAVHLTFNLLTDVKGDFYGRLYVILLSAATWIMLLKYFSMNQKRPIRR